MGVREGNQSGEIPIPKSGREKEINQEKYQYLSRVERSQSGSGH